MVIGASTELGPGEQFDTIENNFFLANFIRATDIFVSLIFLQVL